MTLNLDPKKLLDTAYIFEKTPPATGFYLYLAILFGLFVGFAILGWLWLTRKKDQLPFWKEYRIKIFNLFFYNGVIGLVLIFSRWQGIPYAGSRFFSALRGDIIFFLGFVNYIFSIHNFS